MDNTDDSRFSHIRRDPRFKKIKKHEQKVKVDKRFQSMFNDKKFQVKYNVDKRGRPLNISTRENLKKYYDLSSESEEDGEEEVSEKLEETELKVLECKAKDVKGIGEVVQNKLKNLNVDYARGEGRLLSDSSSDEESGEDEADVEEFDWGELDKDAERTEEISSRLAVCNMDWDRIKADDLMVLLNSFIPSSGSILSVTVYPSEFGIQRMKEEEEKGPPELRDEEKKLVEPSDDVLHKDDDEDSSKHMEKLRKYQLARLKYYYGVIECDSPETANTLYTECDGLEYESSTNKIDLRFIPDDTTFDQVPREKCTSLPDLTKYKPRLFRTSALTQAKVELTWDETDPERLDAVKSFHSRGKGDNIDEAQLMDYVACSSEDEESNEEDHLNLNQKQGSSSSGSDESDGDDDDNKNGILKYKALLASIEENEEKKKKKNVEMEVTWDLSLEKKTDELVKETIKVTEDSNKTPFEQYLAKRKEKKKQKKEQRKQFLKKDNNDDESEDQAFSDDNILSDVDLNDDYFKEVTKGKKKKKKQRVDIEDNESNSKKAQLELLMLDGDEKQVKHFSLKKIEENEKGKKKKLRKGKKRKLDEEKFEDDFKIDVNDDRFSALFTSHHYNIDPADSRYKATKATKDLINEKLRRREVEGDETRTIAVETSGKKRDPELSLLVKNIKRHTNKNK